LSDIEYWAGSGTNRAALVIDWHDGTQPHALAWGFRWNGAATALDLWRAVTNADTGLSGTLSGGLLTGVEYRRRALAGEKLPGTGFHDVRWTACTWDHTGTVFRVSGNWSHWRLDTTNDYSKTAAVWTDAGLAGRALQNGSWDVWSYHPDVGAVPPGQPASALHYPYATTVASYTAGSGISGYPDWVSGDLFNVSATALGRPTVDTTGDYDVLPEDAVIPVVPVYPAFRYFEVVMIGSGGSLTLAFDHPVYDNPKNPYGIDFLVFGNSFQSIQGGGSWDNGNPSNTAVTASCYTEGGTVAVSQDGTTWYTFTGGPYADAFMPTLGRVFDPSAPDPELGAANLWWGYATDPTVPPSPDVIAAYWKGMSIAEIARRYRGSAGGTGFDIGKLDLPPDANTGMKWIRYVRITRSGSYNPEVDAVADVSPAVGYDLWRNDRFAWTNSPSYEADAADPDGDGLANLMEYGLGRDPTNAVPPPAYVMDLCTTGTTRTLRFRYSVATNAPDVAVEIVRADDLFAPVWSTNGVWQPVAVSAPTNGVQPLVSEAPVTGNKGFMRLSVRHDE